MEIKSTHNRFEKECENQCDKNMQKSVIIILMTPMKYNVWKYLALRSGSF